MIGPEGVIYTEDAEGRLVAMRPAAPPSEDDLQDLIARFPEIVSHEGNALLLVMREHGVPDGHEAADRWSLDHLFVSREAVPVLIEVKRASDTRLRREVIGQIMDYAANGVVFWPEGRLENSFVDTCRARGADPALTLQEFLEDRDPSVFWSQVQSNLTAGNIMLVIAADVVPPELARIVEFLNDQMRAEVRAVELRYFVGQDGRRSLAPRIIGATEKTRALKSSGPTARLQSMSVEEWFQQVLSGADAATISGARKHIELIERLGGHVAVSPNGNAPCLRAVFSADDGTEVRPVELWPSGGIVLNFRNIMRRPAFRDEGTRLAIMDRFVAAVGSLSTRNPSGYPSFPASALADPKVAAAYDQAVAELVRLSRA
jgi:hypothetical protein